MTSFQAENKLDELFQNVKQYRSSSQYRALLKACRKFRNLAPYNAMLVSMQRPGANYVLNASDWKNRFNRWIKPNARPIIVLVPFGPVDYLFEISDTYPLNEYEMGDEDILSVLGEPYKTRNEVSDSDLKQLKDNCAFHGISLDMNLRAGAGYGARIECVKGYKPQIEIKLSCQEKIIEKASYILSVNEKAENGERFASIVHELGHLFCYHLQAPYMWNGWECRHLHHSTEEFEAESVSWLICEKLNIGNPSERYLNNYLDNNGDIPAGVSVERIFQAFNEVWKMVRPNHKMTYKDGLLYKQCSEFKEKAKRILDSSKKYMPQPGFLHFDD